MVVRITGPLVLVNVMIMMEKTFNSSPAADGGVRSVS